MNPEEFECYGPNAAPIERMILRIDKRPDSQCQHAYITFDKNDTGRQILDVAAALVIQDQQLTTLGVWKAMQRIATSSFESLPETSSEDAALELLLLAIEWMVRNREPFLAALNTGGA